MKCSKCNADRKVITNTIIKESIIAGSISIPGITYFKCISCNTLVFPPGESQKIFDFIKEKELELISNQPFADFIDISEACRILQINKQAFSKNKRIKRGFILSGEIGGKKFYLKDSIIKFKDSGYKDGRYNL